MAKFIEKMKNLFSKKNNVNNGEGHLRNQRHQYSIDEKIPEEKFALTHGTEAIHDTKFETKPVGYLRDSLSRFAKNKASVVAACIIAAIALFAIVEPMVDPKNRVNEIAYPSGFQDKLFETVRPRLFNPNKAGFWDGTEKKTVGETEYKLSLYSDSNYQKYTLIKENKSEIKIGSKVKVTYTYDVHWDSYAVGVRKVTMNSEAYEKLLAYEQKNSIAFSEDNIHKSIIKPSINYEDYLDNELRHVFEEAGVAETTITRILDQMTTFYSSNQSVYYKLIPTLTNKSDPTSFSDGQFIPYIKDGATAPEDLYVRDGSGNLVFGENVNSERFVRVDYFDYFTYVNGFKPTYIFGANQQGQDICLRLALGARFSLLLGVGITIINFIIGLVYGAISGYYGGTADLIMERITDIISGVPTIIVMTIAQIQLTNNVELKSAVGPGGTIILAILIAFVYNGWVGVAGTTRMQFYRFKGQEYVLASRTLGAKDGRLIFKHILPNAIGTLVTSCVLMVPGVIFSETSLSYLGIIDFTSSGICSIGAMLNEGQLAGLKDNPHVLLFPAVIISLLMICFNLFGNGLRDAFNTSLRGSED